MNYIAQIASLQAGERRYRIYATAGKADDAPPFHVVGSDLELDRRSERNPRSPHALVQDYLNNSDALWGIVTNGDKLRLLRDSILFTRPTYIEFDIKSIIEGNQYAAFTQMYRLLHRTRLPADGQPPDDCLLERYYQDGLDSHSRVRSTAGRRGTRSANARQRLFAALEQRPPPAAHCGGRLIRTQRG